jgi:hypothetical protein
VGIEKPRFWPKVPFLCSEKTSSKRFPNGLGYSKIRKGL